MTPAHIPVSIDPSAAAAAAAAAAHAKNIQLYFNPPDDRKNAADAAANGGTGVTLKHITSTTQICYNSWKRVGLINMKRAAGLVQPAKLNYTD